MKRSQERDMSPRSMKRPRTGYPGSDYDMPLPREKSPLDFDRREGRGSREPKPKLYYDDMRPKYRDDRMDDVYPPPGRTEARAPEYRSLCLSNISSKIPDHVLKETLYREFRKFGEFNVNLMYSGEMRVAYINFRYPEDAREAKHAKAKLILFDRPVRVESVYHKKHNQNNYMPRDNFGYGGGQRSNSPPFQQRRPGPMRPDQNMPPRRDFNPNFNNGSGGGGGGGGQRKAPNEKFPYHLDHVPPEDDDKATRTLFVGNLDYNITDIELRKIFERYGTLEEIDIKRPQRGQGNAYAFLKFMNLDYAHRAKVEMSGQYIGRFQCKIGYGKVTPTTCLWVGGLGPWITPASLEQEFDRFGVIERIEWPQGKSYAYVVYEEVDVAQAAIQDMRGVRLGGTDKRLRVDFADIGHIRGSPRPQEPVQENGRNYSDSQWKGPYDERKREEWREGDPVNAYRNPDNPDRRRSAEFDTRSNDERYKRPVTPEEYGDRRRRRTPDKMYDALSQSRESRRSFRSPERELEEERRDGKRSFSAGSKEYSGEVEDVENITDLSKCLQVAWNGAVILKSSAFPGRMHVVSGDVTIVDTLMRDPTTTETPVLKIKQRLRLDPPKLEDVGRRVSAAGSHGHCILLAMPSSLQNYDDPSVQQRPLKNLVTYLRQKEAAGVISLPPYETKDKENVGVLYAFPPCPFGYEYLSSVAPRLPTEPIQDDYLVIVVIRGGV